MKKELLKVNIYTDLLQRKIYAKFHGNTHKMNKKGGMPIPATSAPKFQTSNRYELLAIEEIEKLESDIIPSPAQDPESRPAGLKLGERDFKESEERTQGLRN